MTTTQIETHDLKALIDGHGVKLLDGSWALDGTNMHALFLEEHIPGTQFFDLEVISDHSTPLPHMAPKPEQFAQALGQMGISANDHVVIYDRQGLFSAARVWWTFKLMGHENVHVLRGGLPAWKTAGFPVSDQVVTPVPTIYIPRYNGNKIIDINLLYEYVDSSSCLILDARPAARFIGAAPEPRVGLRSGHMPRSCSLPFSMLIRDGALKPQDELLTLFSALGVTPGRQIVTTCGSGVTAAILSMALDEIGHTQALLYDGSWAEWGQEALDTPVVTSDV